RPRGADCLNPIPIRPIYDGREVVRNRDLWPSAAHAIDKLGHCWGEIADDRRVAQEMPDQAPVPHLPSLIALTEERNLFLVQPSCNGLMSNAGESLSIDAADDVGTFLDNDELALGLVESKPARAAC